MLVVAVAALSVMATPGCLDDAPSVKERLLSERSVSGLGLHHCEMGEAFQEAGLSSNPAKMSPEDFAGNGTRSPTEVWMQILTPLEDARCEQVVGNESVFVTAMRFESTSVVAEFVDEEDPCEDVEGAVFVHERDVVSTGGDEALLGDVRRLVADENPDLSPLCG